MIKKMGYRWNLRRLMAGKDMFQTTDLVPLLAERGITLSREQVFRLVTQPPQRLSMDTLAALCDILDCTPNDLIEIEAVNAEVRKTAGESRYQARRCGARRSASPKACDASLDRGPACPTGGADGCRGEFGDHPPCWPQYPGWTRTRPAVRSRRRSRSTCAARRDSSRSWSHTCAPTPTRWAPVILDARPS